MQNNHLLLLGTEYGTGYRIDMLLEQLSVHAFVAGGSGTGKSKFLELVMRQLMAHRIGFMYVDPHGDTAKDLVSFAAARKVRGDDVMWRRTHYLKIDKDLCFSLDPFANLPRRGEVSSVIYNACLDTKVQFLSRAILRRFGNAEVELMNRLNRWLQNVLYYCGTSFDGKNSHHGLDKMLVAINPQSPQFDDLFSQVAPFLPAHVLADYLMLKSMKRAIDQEKFVESTGNNLRQLFNTLVREIFAQNAAPLNLGKIMQESGHVLLDLGQSAYCGKMQKSMIAGLLIQEALHTKYMESELMRGDRIVFVLVIDEAGQYLGEDLKEAMEGTRKFNLPVVLCAQNLASFAKGDLDLAPQVLSLCGTVVCFQQTYRKDKEILADRLGTGDLDFTRMLQEVQRQRGWIENKTLEHSYGTQSGKTWSQGGSQSQGTTVNETISEMESLMRGHAHAHSISTSNSVANTAGTTQGGSSGKSESREGALLGSPQNLREPTLGSNATSNFSNQSSATNGHTEGQGETTTTNEALTKGKTKGIGRGQSHEVGKSWQDGGSEGNSHTVSVKTTLLPNMESSWEWNGLYVQGAAADQFEKLMQTLHCLSVAEAIVSLRGVKESFLVKIDTVEEWWKSEADKAEAIRRLIARLWPLRPYYFNPSTLGIEEPEPEALEVGPDVIVRSVPRGSATSYEDD